MLRARRAPLLGRRLAPWTEPVALQVSRVRIDTARSRTSGDGTSNLSSGPAYGERLKATGLGAGSEWTICEHYGQLRDTLIQFWLNAVPPEGENVTVPVTARFDWEVRPSTRI